MATVIVKAGNFTAGETVNAYVRQKSGDYTTVPAVASAVAAADGSVAIGPVTGKRAYKLIGQTSGNKIDGYADNILAPDGTDLNGVVLPGATTGLGSSSTLALAAGTLYLCRYCPLVDSIITKVSIDVTAVDATDPAFEVAIYDLAGQKLATTGDARGQLTVLGARVINLLTPWQAKAGNGVYAGVISGAAGTLRAVLGTGTPGWMQALGTDMPKQIGGTIAVGAGSVPTPANVGTVLAAGPNHPILGLLVS